MVSESEQPSKPAVLTDEEAIKAQKKLKKKEQKQLLCKIIQKQIFATLPKIAELAKAMVLSELKQEKKEETKPIKVITAPAPAPAN